MLRSGDRTPGCLSYPSNRPHDATCSSNALLGCGQINVQTLLRLRDCVRNAFALYTRSTAAISSTCGLIETSRTCIVAPELVKSELAAGAPRGSSSAGDVMRALSPSVQLLQQQQQLLLLLMPAPLRLVIERMMRSGQLAHRSRPYSRRGRMRSPRNCVRRYDVRCLTNGMREWLRHACDGN